MHFPGNLLCDARGGIKRVFLAINNEVIASTAEEEFRIKTLVRAHSVRSADSDHTR